MSLINTVMLTKKKLRLLMSPHSGRATGDSALAMDCGLSDVDYYELAVMLVQGEASQASQLCDRPWTYRKHRSERWRQIRTSARFSIKHSRRINWRRSEAARQKIRAGGRFRAAPTLVLSPPSASME